jgi:hypothetical protein
LLATSLYSRLNRSDREKLRRPPERARFDVFAFRSPTGARRTSAIESLKLDACGIPRNARTRAPATIRGNALGFDTSRHGLCSRARRNFQELASNKIIASPSIPRCRARARSDCDHQAPRHSGPCVYSGTVLRPAASTRLVQGPRHSRTMSGLSAASRLTVRGRFGLRGRTHENVKNGASGVLRSTDCRGVSSGRQTFHCAGASRLFVPTIQSLHWKRSSVGANEKRQGCRLQKGRRTGVLHV